MHSQIHCASHTPTIMISLFVTIALAAAASASLVPLDTPEVAHAKAQHLAIVEQTKHRDILGSTHLNIHHPASAAHGHGWYASAWGHGSAAPVVVNGHVQDEPEVALAKAKHLAIVAAESARNGAASSGHYPGVWNVEGGVHANVHSEEWHPSEGYLRYGPAHIVVVDGQVQDTPEVAHAKAKHYQALHEVESSHGSW